MPSKFGAVFQEFFNKFGELKALALKFSKGEKFGEVFLEDLKEFRKYSTLGIEACLDC